MSQPSLFVRLAHVRQAQGLRGVLLSVTRRILRPRARVFGALRERVADRVGFEIGGPSPIFAEGGLLPVYPLARRIDNCNFAATTLWEMEAADGGDFRFAADRAPGRQYTAEATHLPALADASVDFVLSSHSLEHTANPLKALGEWRRILRPEGVLVLIVPHRDGTFDHRRPVTRLEHIVDDFAADRAEDDLTHLDEVLALHDLRRDPDAEPREFEGRMRRNAEFRSMHHHVFDAMLAVRVAERAGFQVLDVEVLRPHHIIVIAEKRDGPLRPWNGPLRSPFPADHASAAEGR